MRGRVGQLDQVVNAATIAIANPGTIDATVRANASVLDIPRGRPVAGGGQILHHIAAALANRTTAERLVGQLADLKDHNPSLDLPMVMAIAARETPLPQLLTPPGGRGRSGTFFGGGLDFMGRALRRGARSSIPSGYSQGRNRWVPQVLGTFEPASVPHSEMLTAYGVYISFLMSHLIQGRIGGMQPSMFYRFMTQLHFGGPNGVSYAAYQRGERAHAEGGQARPDFGAATVIDFATAHRRATMAQVFQSQRRVLHNAFGDRVRYRRALVSSAEATSLQTLALIPANLSRSLL